MYLDKVITGFQVEPLNQPLSYEGNLNTSISRNATFSAAGAPQTPGNLNAASDNVSSILVSTSPAITNFGVRLINASQLNELSSLDLDGRIVVPPNSNIVISFLGQLAVSAMDADITVTWYEL
ncbi:hypothetical protein SDC9_147661 [bioreactor metagenome]|uniref:Uncharacterized protein n=1 Tax=bioreactor metagenome TaxID=1076179 RepID=A0A645EG93_9ZZZZ